MWLFTKHGFFSVVCASQRNGNHGQPIDTTRLVVRARVRQHLEALKKRWPTISASAKYGRLPEPTTPSGALSTNTHGLVSFLNWRSRPITTTSNQKSRVAAAVPECRTSRRYMTCGRRCSACRSKISVTHTGNRCAGHPSCTVVGIPRRRNRRSRGSGCCGRRRTPRPAIAGRDSRTRRREDR
jgi:hypothetical protein